MKVAYLITAYNNFNHLIALIKKIKVDNSLVYIHIDKKTIIPDFFTSFSQNEKNLTIISTVEVWWGGWSHQQAILDLINEAKKEKPDYYVIMSGQDYPIRDRSEFLELQSKNKEYITIMQGFHQTKPEDRIRYHYFDCFDRRSKSLKTVIYKLAERFLRIIYRKKNYPFSTIYHGSTWCALSGSCVDYILDFMDKNPHFVDFFKTSWCAEESFFPTIIGNSYFINNVSPGIWYTDWEGVNPPVALTEKHISLFKENDFFYNKTYDITYCPYFARKFNDGNQDIRSLLD
ncbi:beta-1,6-N-acetylglucosaminyltransferase [Klebsiella michiganensis]